MVPVGVRQLPWKGWNKVATPPTAVATPIALLLSPATLIGTSPSAGQCHTLTGKCHSIVKLVFHHHHFSTMSPLPLPFPATSLLSSPIEGVYNNPSCTFNLFLFMTILTKHSLAVSQYFGEPFANWHIRIKKKKFQIYLKECFKELLTDSAC